MFVVFGLVAESEGKATMALAHNEDGSFAFNASRCFIAKKISKRAPHAEAVGRSKLRAIQDHPPYAPFVDYDVHYLSGDSDPKDPFR
jgi:hypothetical protein